MTQATDQARKTILVTGGAGYIGAHGVLALQNAGYDVIILDNLVYGHRDVAEKLDVPLIIGDTNDRSLLNQIFAEHQIAAVMHFAAYAYVGESVTAPDKCRQRKKFRIFIYLCYLRHSSRSSHP